MKLCSLRNAGSIVICQMDQYYQEDQENESIVEFSRFNDVLDVVLPDKRATIYPLYSLIIGKDKEGVPTAILENFPLTMMNLLTDGVQVVELDVDIQDYAVSVIKKHLNIIITPPTPKIILSSC